MKKRTLLGIFVVLLVVGAYAAYALNNSKLPEVKGCVNPFREVKPVSKTAENWSRIHVFFKAVLSKDIRSLVKPWEIDYRTAMVFRHTVEYNGEKITMLAIGFLSRDKKHALAYYEFSKPIYGVRTLAKLVEIKGETARLTSLSINGKVITLSTCQYECSGHEDCGVGGVCGEYCCEPCKRSACMAACVAPGCYAVCGVIPWPYAIPCWMLCAAFCCDLCCGEEGTHCYYPDSGP